MFYMNAGFMYIKIIVPKVMDAVLDAKFGVAIPQFLGSGLHRRYFLYEDWVYNDPILINYLIPIGF
jgi:hypothetical protein